MLCRDFHDLVLKNIRKSLDIGNEIAITEMYCGSEKELNNTYECCDAYYGQYYKYREYRNSPPVDEELIDKMAPYALEIIKMMDRPQSWEMVFEDRMLLYFEHIRFWSYVLDYYKINRVIFFNAPHEVFDYVIYCLCKVKDIKMTIFYMASPFSNRSLVFSDIDCIGKGLDNIIEKYIEKYKETNIENISLPAECERMYKKYTKISKEIDSEKLRNENPWTFLDENFYLKNLVYMDIRHMLEKKFKKKTNGKEVAKELKQYLEGDKRIYKKAYQVNHYLKNKKMSDYYSILATYPQSGEKYILFALQLQPEVTTAPLAGGIFSNQIIIIDMLASNLPKGMMLYVKEHPSQVYTARTKTFYQRISRIKNVRLINSKVNQYELIKNCVATSTATGTIAIESVILNKPCIVFGKFIYNHLEGTIHVRKNEDCIKAINDIVMGNIIIEKKNIKIFFKALFEYSKEGNIGYWNYNMIKNAKLISETIIEELKMYN